jgi:spore germination protein GerM
VLLAVGVGILLALLLLSPRNDRPVDEAEEGWVDDAEVPAQKPIMLYFGRPDGHGLASEIRWVDGRAAAEDVIGDVVRSLIDGSRGGLVSSIPSETVLLEVFLDGSGGAYLNFSESLRSMHPRGDAMEWLTVRSIVASVTQNVPEVRRVWILVDGKQGGPLTGRVPLNRPYSWEDVES